jgi:hypothetical protein
MVECDSGERVSSVKDSPMFKAMEAFRYAVSLALMLELNIATQALRLFYCLLTSVNLAVSRLSYNR